MILVDMCHHELMRKLFYAIYCLVCQLGFLFCCLAGEAAGTAFSYQGRLLDTNGPLTGSYDLAFTLYVSSNGGTPVAGPVTNLATEVSGGKFAVTIDFGPGVFAGGSNWLEIAVQTNQGNGFVTLSPRQAIAPVPWAIYANTAASLTGALPTAQLPTNVLLNGATGVYLSGKFSGDGAGLTNLSLPAGTGGAGGGSNLDGWASLPTNALPTTAAQVGAVSTNGWFSPEQLPGIGLNLDAISYNSLPNGAPIPVVYDLSGNGNHFNAANWTFNAFAGIGGGFHLGSQWYPAACLASNATFLANNPALNTNCFAVFVFQTPQLGINQPYPPGGQILVAGNRGGGWGLNILDNQSANGIGFEYSTNANLQISKNYDGLPVVLAWDYTATNLTIWVNGLPQCTGVPNRKSGLGFSGNNLYLGNFPNSSWRTYNGDILKLLIFTNGASMSLAQKATIAQFYTTKYRVDRVDFLIMGDSLATGVVSTNGATFKDQYHGAYPSKRIGFTCFPGQSSGAQYSNLLANINWLRSVPGDHLAFLYASDINESLARWGYLQTYGLLTNIASVYASNNWSFMVATPASSFQTDILSPGQGTNLANQIMSNTNLFAAVVPTHAAPNIGPFLSCSNNPVYFFNDSNHWTAAAYNSVSNLLVAGVAYALNPPIRNGGGLTNLAAAQLTGVASVNTTGNAATASVASNVVAGIAITNGTLSGSLDTYAQVVLSQGSGNAPILTIDNNSNTFLGINAGSMANAGHNNVAIGYAALQNNVTGSNNTVLGSLALANTTTGNNNLILGYQAGSNYSGAESGNILIGNAGMVAESNVVRLGSSQTATYLVGTVNGNGSGLTNLNAGNLTSGSLATNVLDGWLAAQMLHASGVPTFTTNIGASAAGLVSNNGDQSITFWFISTNSVTYSTGQKILTINFAHPYASPPGVWFTAGPTSTGGSPSNDGGMRTSLFQVAVSTTQAIIEVSSTGNGQSLSGGVIYTNCIGFIGK